MKDLLDFFLIHKIDLSEVEGKMTQKLLRSSNILLQSPSHEELTKLLESVCSSHFEKVLNKTYSGIIQIIIQRYQNYIYFLSYAYTLDSSPTFINLSSANLNNLSTENIKEIFLRFCVASFMRSIRVYNFTPFLLVHDGTIPINSTISCSYGDGSANISFYTASDISKFLEKVQKMSETYDNLTLPKLVVSLKNQLTEKKVSMATAIDIALNEIYQFQSENTESFDTHLIKEVYSNLESANLATHFVQPRFHNKHFKENIILNKLMDEFIKRTVPLHSFDTLASYVNKNNQFDSLFEDEVITADSFRFWQLAKRIDVNFSNYAQSLSFVQAFTPEMNIYDLALMHYKFATPKNSKPKLESYLFTLWYNK